MAQPKTAPISVRLGEPRLARIDAFAAKHKLARHLAILVLIDQGLSVIDTPEPRTTVEITPIDPSRPRVIKGVIEPENAKAAPFRGVTATGEALPVRGPMQKTGKKS